MLSRGKRKTWPSRCMPVPVREATTSCGNPLRATGSASSACGNRCSPTPISSCTFANTRAAWGFGAATKRCRNPISRNSNRRRRDNAGQSPKRARLRPISSTKAWSKCRET